jgi:glycosyltransferase involved in cell wall biosynthesis
MRVVVLTHSASPYQVELFNAVALFAGFKVRVVYLYRSDPSRNWSPPVIMHPAICLDEESDSFNETLRDILNADLVVFNYYAEKVAQIFIQARARTRKPWCFWGERPGSRKPEWIGRVMRRRSLAWLHKSSAPIWGIGRFGVARYKKEFGCHRSYYNLPYFSNLARFQSSQQILGCPRLERVFLFSGSLVYRKGVDLLSRSFVRLASEFPHVRLRVLGDGKLRFALEQTLRTVYNRVEFLGFKDWSALPACYGGANVLCVPSRYDGWGLVVPEGLASGLPVIGTAFMGAAVEFLKNGDNGWLVPAGDENALLAAMREAAELPEAKLAIMSRHARESVAEHSLQHGAERFIRAAYDAVRNWES